MSNAYALQASGAEMLLHLNTLTLVASLPSPDQIRKLNLFLQFNTPNSFNLKKFYIAKIFTYMISNLKIYKCNMKVLCDLFLACFITSIRLQYIVWDILGYFQALLTGNAETLSHLCILNAFTFYILHILHTYKQPKNSKSQGRVKKSGKL